MVLQAKLERRQRRQMEKSGKASVDSTHSSMLGSRDDNIAAAGHPQSIPPPSEPVLPAGTKVSSPKPANGTTTSSHERVYVAGETVRPEHDIRSQSPPRGYTEDKSEARHSANAQKGELMTATLIASSIGSQTTSYD